MLCQWFSWFIGITRKNNCTPYADNECKLPTKPSYVPWGQHGMIEAWSLAVIMKDYWMCSDILCIMCVCDTVALYTYAEWCVYLRDSCTLRWRGRVYVCVHEICVRWQCHCSRDGSIRDNRLWIRTWNIGLTWHPAVQRCSLPFHPRESP